MSQTGYMSSLLPTVLEKQITKIKKIYRALNKYHRRKYYCVNIFKFLLPESKVYSSLHIFLSSLLLSSLLPTKRNRDDKW